MKPRLEPAHLVILAGMSAALHVGKLPPAIAALQQALGMGLLQAGFLLSLVQLAGMSLGLVMGALADGMGARRSILLGLTTLGLASLCGAAADGVTSLLVLRVVEGFGFLLVVLPAPGLIRSLVVPARLSASLGWWGTYMPTAMALALLCGPLWIQAWGWRGWWLLLGLVSLLMTWVVARGVAPQVPPQVPRLPAQPRTPRLWWHRLRQTLGAAGPWLVAAVFACYSGQWLAVVGFLPTVYAQAGVASVWVGPLTAAVAAANIIGNVASGRALQRGVAATHLLMLGFGGMAVASIAAFAPWAAPAELRYLAVLVFSGVGGLIPSTLFSLALRVAPDEGCVGSTVGWMQQWSSLGQFAGPPVLAWLAVQVGGWQATGWFTAACCSAGVVLTASLRPLLQRSPR